MPKLIRNIISVPLLLRQDFEINIKDNNCPIIHSNKIFGIGFIENGLLVLSLNDNFFHINMNMKRKREDINEIYLGITVLVISMSQE